MLQPRVPGNNSLSRTVRIVECSLSHRQAQGRVSSQPRTPTDFCENLTYRECTAQAHIPRFLKPSLESVKGRHNQVTAVIHHQKGQPVMHCSLHHEDYKADWLHRGLLHSFWQRETWVWNLGFVSLGGQSAVGMLSPWLPGTQSKAHWKGKIEFPSFSRCSELSLFLSSLTETLSFLELGHFHTHFWIPSTQQSAAHQMLSGDIW